MTGRNKSTDYVRGERHNRLLRELVHDPYMSKKKLSEPTVCPDCGALFQKGRWAWGDISETTQKKTCPACQRIQEKVPAGFLTLNGEFLTDHKEEIINLLQNLESREKAEHPLKRIMDIEEQEDGLLISFTEPHLARSAGEAITHAYQGELDFNYTPGEYLLRVSWSR